MWYPTSYCDRAWQMCCLGRPALELQSTITEVGCAACHVMRMEAVNYILKGAIFLHAPCDSFRSLGQNCHTHLHLAGPDFTMIRLLQ